MNGGVGQQEDAQRANCEEDYRRRNLTEDLAREQGHGSARIPTRAGAEARLTEGEQADGGDGKEESTKVVTGEQDWLIDVAKEPDRYQAE
jgi:hypothetical protein